MSEDWKPSPARLLQASYPRLTAVPMRFSDFDMFRHINNVALGEFYEEARFELLAEARSQVEREFRDALVIANVNISYLRQARYPGVVNVGTGIVRVGPRSAAIGQALFVDGSCISTADTVIVSVGPDGPRNMADAVRAFLLRFLLDGQ